MAFIIAGLSLIVGLVSLVCWIYTVVVAFQNEDAITGILCLCPLIGLVMGFIKMKEWGHEKVMTVWGICVLVNIILQVVTPIIAPAG